jgi:hypothetical protein
MSETSPDVNPPKDANTSADVNPAGLVDVPPVINRPVADRFEVIKEMIELPEVNVTGTRKPYEPSDEGLPTGLLMVIGIAILAIGMMAVIFFGVGNDVVNIVLGNHFMR